MKARIGYFIPEFPGQTHMFFWREREILAELGIETELVSTRRPPIANVSHVWASEAQKNTDYLFPLTIKDFIVAFLNVFKAGPIALLRCLKVIAQARDTSLVQKLRLLAMILFAGKLVWLARSKDWSHVHVHSCADAANVCIFASILADITYSMTLHGPILEEYGPNQAQKWKHAAFALVISEKLFRDVKNKLANFLPKQVAVAPMGVDLAKIKRHAQYTPWEGGDSCRIFCCARLNVIKGYNYLLETVELLRKQGFDVRLQIAGEDDYGGSGYRLEIEKIIQEKSLSEYVELLGAVSEERVRKGLEEAHVFALASLREGIPVAVMEAMAMEMPIIVTDVGGNSELIDDGVDAILVQPAEPAEMADAIAKVLKDKELALNLSQASRKKIAEKFHHRRSAETLAQCLKGFA